MNRSLATAIVVFGILLSGCEETALRPSTQARQESGLMAPKVDDRAVFFLFSSDSPLKVASFSSNGGSFKVKFESAVSPIGALATAFTKDGYLITAGHVAHAHVLVIGMMNGEARAVPARVVYKKSFGTFGTDFAVLHVDQPIDCPLRLGQFKPGETAVFGLGCDRAAESNIRVIGGIVRSAKRSEASDQILLLDTDLPSWHGDSGGGVVSRDGELFGVITGFKTNWSGLHNAKLVCAPSKDLVESIVASDRINTVAQRTSEAPGTN